MAITGYDPSRNFAIANLNAGISNSATSIVLVAGKGALFPDPSVDGAFNVPLYNSTDYTSPWSDPDVEIVRVTARSTDTLTVTRAQEGTAAVAHNTGGKTYSLYMALTRKGYDDLVAGLIAVRGVTLGGTGAATFTDGGVLIGNGTGAVQVTSAGTAGQVLTSNGAGADPTFQPISGGNPSLILRDTYSCRFTDDIQYIAALSGSTIALLRKSVVFNLGVRYKAGVVQNIATTSLLAGANNPSVICAGGFVYAYLSNSGGGTFSLFRIATSGDINSAGNWTTLTLSGASFGTNVNLIGYENGNFWFSDNSSKFFKATLSGTTMTETSSVTVSGSSYSSVLSVVNSTGIYAAFAGSPTLRKADLTGSLVTDATISGPNSSFALGSDLYVSNSTSTPYTLITL